MPKEASWLAPQDRSRVYVSLAALGAAMALTAAFLLFFVAFIWPARDTGTSLARYYAGTPDQFDVGKPVVFPDAQFWLVKQEDGSFVAFYWKSPHMGCTVPWREDFRFIDPRDGQQKLGWFRDPCHGATLDINGVRVYGPSPRNLDQFPVTVREGRIYVAAVEAMLIRGD